MEKNIKEKIQQKVREIEDLETQIFNLEQLEKMKNELATKWMRKAVFYQDHIRIVVGSIDDENSEVFFIYYRDFNQKEMEKIYKFLLFHLNETTEQLKKRIASMKTAILK